MYGNSLSIAERSARRLEQFLAEEADIENLLETQLKLIQREQARLVAQYTEGPELVDSTLNKQHSDSLNRLNGSLARLANEVTKQQKLALERGPKLSREEKVKAACNYILKQPAPVRKRFLAELEASLETTLTP